MFTLWSHKFASRLPLGPSEGSQLIAAQLVAVLPPVAIFLANLGRQPFGHGSKVLAVRAICPNIEVRSIKKMYGQNDLTHVIPRANVVFRRPKGCTSLAHRADQLQHRD
jgi:hypothetical protein